MTQPIDQDGLYDPAALDLAALRQVADAVINCPPLADLNVLFGNGLPDFGELLDTFHATFNPRMVRALLDRLEAAERGIADRNADVLAMRRNAYAARAAADAERQRAYAAGYRAALAEAERAAETWEPLWDKWHGLAPDDVPGKIAEAIRNLEVPDEPEQAADAEQQRAEGRRE